MELHKFIEDLNNGKVLALPEPEQEEPATQQVLPKENKALSLLEEINQHLQGKDYRPSLNGKVKGRK